MEAAGGVVSKIPGEDLSMCDVKYGDSVWAVYEEWASSFEENLRICAAFAPGPEIGNSTLCPPLAIAGTIVTEANSVIVHYAPLPPVAIEGGAVPNIPRPIPFPPALTTYAHPKLALSALMQRIQTPPADYAALSSLCPGSYICTIMHIWANAAVTIVLYK
jgi:hypothetical protein